MSDTPKLADECKKLLDSGHTIVLFANELGTYTALDFSPDVDLDLPPHREITDDFEPSQALYRLTEKVFGNIVWPRPSGWQ